LILKYPRLRGLPWNFNCLTWILMEEREKTKKKSFNNNSFKKTKHALQLKKKNAVRNLMTLWEIIFHCCTMLYASSKRPFDIAFVTAFHQILNFFFAKIECGLYFLDRFDVLMSKIIFKKWKSIIDMYFGTKSYLKSNRYHTAKHTLRMEEPFHELPCH
jgi:hypothetical protein